MAGFLPYFVPCELLVCYEEKREETNIHGKEQREERYERYTYWAKRQAAKDLPVQYEGGFDLIMGGIHILRMEESSATLSLCLREGLKNFDANKTFIHLFQMSMSIQKIKQISIQKIRRFRTCES